MAILSDNSSRWARYLTNKFHFNEIFNPIVVSGDCKFSKAEPEIYKYFLNQVNLPGSKILFVDDRESNLERAKSAGFVTCWYEKENDVSSLKSDFRIKRLGEVAMIV